MDKQLRHRICQASLREVQRAIDERSRDYGAPALYKDPKNTSKYVKCIGQKLNIAITQE
ncbi:MAG: hypothetical protein QXJ65_01750 [Acidilobaceae archaeon]